MIKTLLKAAGLAAVLFFGHVAAAHAGECQLYEQAHPNFPLTGSHLSAGKCTTCASCHISGIFVGTPKQCKTCHVANSSYGAVGFSTNHFPIGSADCGSCHNTTDFVTKWAMDHTAVTGMACQTCHSGNYATGYNALGQAASAQFAGYTHPVTTPANADCASSGCHTAPGVGMMLSESLWQLNFGQIHMGITTGCVSCHDGIHAKGKSNVPKSTTLPNGHPITSDSCEQCHSVSQTTSFKCAELMDQLHLAFKKSFLKDLEQQG